MLGWRVCCSNTQQTQNSCITFIQCWTSVVDARPTLYKCYTNVLCLLGRPLKMMFINNEHWPFFISYNYCFKLRVSMIRLAVLCQEFNLFKPEFTIVIFIHYKPRIIDFWTCCGCKNELNRALGHLCAHIGYTGPGEPPEDGEMIEMTLSSRHRIRNSSPGGLRPITLFIGHGGSPQYWLSHVDGEETFLFLSNRRDRNRTLNSRVKGTVLTTTLGPPPCCGCRWLEVGDKKLRFY